MTSHQLHTPKSTNAVARARNASGSYASRAGAQTLIRQALDAIRQLAQLDGESPSLMLAVLDELRSEIEREIDADLVEVSPGSFLPSHEARQLEAIRERDAHDELMAFVESRCELPKSTPEWERFGLVTVAHRRSHDDDCERGTTGCCVDHTASGVESNCETW